ncbi:hypothetical protein EXVC031PHodr_022 [Pelagibacter phage EXVC032P Baldr]|nr:hypothetical protein EXVC031PHodr_022 [Pelagibacter phage EXVC032P Baldr]
MATVNLGSIRFNWKGAYNNSTAYVVNDVVTSSGNSYVCIQASQGNAVGNATAYWNIMSSAGTNGTNGTDLTSTLTTQGDILYRDGSGLARLGYGTAGQVLQTGGSGANPSWTTVSSGKIKQTHWQWDDQQAQIPNVAGNSSTGLEVINYSFTAQSANPHFSLDFSFFHGHYYTGADGGDLYAIAYIEEGGTLRYSFGFKKTGGFRSNSTFYGQSNAFFLEDSDGGIYSNGDQHWSGNRQTYAGVMGNQASADTTASPSTNITAGDTLTLKIKLGGNGTNYYNRSNGSSNSHSRSWFKLQELDNSL